MWNIRTLEREGNTAPWWITGKLQHYPHPPTQSQRQGQSVFLYRCYYWGHSELGWEEPLAQLLARISSTQGMSSVTRAYTAGVEVEQVLLSQDTMLTRVQTAPFWQTRGRQSCPAGGKWPCVQA